MSAGLARLPSLPTELARCLVDDAPHAGLAHAFLEALLSGERHLASRMVLDAVASGVTVKDVYQHVFQTALYEVGRRWQLNDISVAQEHYCTAATQLIISARTCRRRPSWTRWCSGTRRCWGSRPRCPAT